MNPSSSSSATCLVAATSNGNSNNNNNSNRNTMRKSRRTKSVAFDLNKDTKVYEVNYIDTKYLKDVWYSKDDIKSIKLLNKALVRNLKNLDSNKDEDKGDNQEQEEENYTTRGLEKLLTTNKNDKQQDVTSRGSSNSSSDDSSFMKYRALYSVLEEQDRQYAIGIYEPRTIAAVYRMNGAGQCQQNASLMGYKDFKACHYQ